MVQPEAAVSDAAARAKDWILGFVSTVDRYRVDKMLDEYGRRVVATHTAALRTAAEEFLNEKTIAETVRAMSRTGRDRAFALETPEYAADCESVTLAYEKLHNLLEGG